MRISILGSASGVTILQSPPRLKKSSGCNWDNGEPTVLGPLFLQTRSLLRLLQSMPEMVSQPTR
jgi:hypothetical protein